MKNLWFSIVLTLLLSQGALAQQPNAETRQVPDEGRIVNQQPPRAPIVANQIPQHLQGLHGYILTTDRDSAWVLLDVVCSFYDLDIKNDSVTLYFPNITSGSVKINDRENSIFRRMEIRTMYRLPDQNEVKTFRVPAKEVIPVVEVELKCTGPCSVEIESGSTFEFKVRRIVETANSG